RGIGKSIAEELARAGARIALCSRKAEACEEVRREFESKGFEVLARSCNVSHREDLQALIDDTVRRWGRIDIVVANAAINPYYGPLTGIPDEAFDKILAANVKSVLWLAGMTPPDRKSTRLNSSHGSISYAVFCLKKKNRRCYNKNHALESC